MNFHLTQKVMYEAVSATDVESLIQEKVRSGYGQEKLTGSFEPLTSCMAEQRHFLPTPFTPHIKAQWWPGDQMEEAMAQGRPQQGFF